MNGFQALFKGTQPVSNEPTPEVSPATITVSSTENDEIGLQEKIKQMVKDIFSQLMRQQNPPNCRASKAKGAKRLQRNNAKAGKARKVMIL